MDFLIEEVGKTSPGSPAREEETLEKSAYGDAKEELSETYWMKESPKEEPEPPGEWDD